MRHIIEDGLTETNIPIITRLVEAGVRQKELAKFFNRSQPRVSRFLAKHNIKHATKRPLTYDHEFILKCREDGLTAAETQELTGASRWTIYDVWRKAIRAEKTPTRRPEVTPEEKRLFDRLKKAGLTTPEISRITGRSTSVIGKYRSAQVTQVTRPEPTYPPAWEILE